MKTGIYKNPSYKQYLPQETLDAIEGIKAVTGKSRQAIVRNAIKYYLLYGYQKEIEAPYE